MERTAAGSVNVLASSITETLCSEAMTPMRSEREEEQQSEDAVLGYAEPNTTRKFSFLDDVRRVIAVNASCVFQFVFQVAETCCRSCSSARAPAVSNFDNLCRLLPSTHTPMYQPTPSYHSSLAHSLHRKISQDAPRPSPSLTHVYLRHPQQLVQLSRQFPTRPHRVVHRHRLSESASHATALTG